MTPGKPCRLCGKVTEDWPIKSLDKPHLVDLEIAPDHRAFSKKVHLKNKMILAIFCAACLRQPHLYKKVMHLPSKEPSS